MTIASVIIAYTIDPEYIKTISHCIAIIIEIIAINVNVLSPKKYNTDIKSNTSAKIIKVSNIVLALTFSYKYFLVNSHSILFRHILLQIASQISG